MKILLSIENLNLTHEPKVLPANLSFQLNHGEHIYITGPSGSGKSTLLQILGGDKYSFTGEISHNFIGKTETGIYSLQKQAAFVFFQHQQINYGNYYYQQRYYSTEVEGTFTVNDFLFGQSNTEFNDLVTRYFQEFEIEHLLEKEFIKLSNGETRKALIAKALLKNPKLLALDDPYLGIDTAGRATLNSLVDYIAGQGIQVILTGNEKKLPGCITHYLKLNRENGYDFGPISGLTHHNEYKINNLPELSLKSPKASFKTAFQFKQLCVRYGETIILDNLDWTVLQGEKWTLTGANGSGKSMLLSLLFADHPQAYANEIILFDKPRGQGETIWEIKDMAGYVSPEMHFYFNRGLAVTEVLQSVLYENPYNPQKLERFHNQFIERMLSYYNKEHILLLRFGELSTSEQRLVLFLRTILKNTPVLLLDEPFQGFDEEMIEKSKKLLNVFCQDRTLVLITHHESEIPAIISKFANLAHGKLTFQYR